MSQNSPVVPARPRAKPDVESSNNIPVVPSRPRKQVKSEDSESSLEKGVDSSESYENKANVSEDKFSEDAHTDAESTSLSPQENSIARASVESTKKEGEISGGMLSAIVSEIYDKSSSPEPTEDEFETPSKEPRLVDDSANMTVQIKESTDVVFQPRADSGAITLGDETEENTVGLPVYSFEEATLPSSGTSQKPSSELSDLQSAVPKSEIAATVPSIPKRPKRGDKTHTVSSGETTAEEFNAKDATPSAESGPESSKSPLDSAKNAVSAPNPSFIDEEHSEVSVAKNSEEVAQKILGNSPPATEHNQNMSKESAPVDESSIKLSPSEDSSAVDSATKETRHFENAPESPKVGLNSEAAVPQPVIPKRPTRTSTPKIPSRPVKSKSAVSEKSISKNDVSDAGQGPPLETDPKTKVDVELDTRSEKSSGDKADTNVVEVTKKAPPPKPKKLSSKIAAFQQMFNQAPLQHTAPASASRKYGEERGKLSSEQTDFASNLQNMMGAGIALPGMANPEILKKLAPAAASDESEKQADEDEKEKKEEATSGSGSGSSAGSSIPRRARGPRGKKLPKSIQEAKIEVKPRFQISVSEVWSVDLRSVKAEDDTGAKSLVDKIEPSTESEVTKIVSAGTDSGKTDPEDIESGSETAEASETIDTVDHAKTENGAFDEKETTVPPAKEKTTHADSLTKSSSAINSLPSAVLGSAYESHKSSEISESNTDAEETSVPVDETDTARIPDVKKTVTPVDPLESTHADGHLLTKKSHTDTSSWGQHMEEAGALAMKSVTKLTGNTSNAADSEQPLALEEAADSVSEKQIDGKAKTQEDSVTTKVPKNSETAKAQEGSASNPSVGAHKAEAESNI